MRALICVLLLSAVPSVGRADEPAVTLKTLQGTWRCIWFEYQGARVDKSKSDMRLVIKDDSWGHDISGREMGRRQKIVVDSSASPTVIDLTDEGKLFEGICQIKGNT